MGKHRASRPGGSGRYLAIIIATALVAVVFVAAYAVLDFLTQGDDPSQEATTGELIDDSRAQSARATNTSKASKEDKAKVDYGELCAACHGQQGEGRSAPTIKETSLTTDQLAEVIVKGTQNKPGYGAGLPSERVKALADYIKGL